MDVCIECEKINKFRPCRSLQFKINESQCLIEFGENWYPIVQK